MNIASLLNNSKTKRVRVGKRRHLERDTVFMVGVLILCSAFIALLSWSTYFMQRFSEARREREFVTTSTALFSIAHIDEVLDVLDERRKKTDTLLQSVGASISFDGFGMASGTVASSTGDVATTTPQVSGVGGSEFASTLMSDIARILRMFGGE
jgi:UDP-N-acetylmuramyl pentapeptide phosphotransferase/UDP-N-acetylglucosamine-1-phosphate transferase